MKNPVRPDEWKYYMPLVMADGHYIQTMLELGDKINPAIGTYKDYFEWCGVDHTSVDWNGLHGALNRDLRQPLDIGMFDMVTNIGTTEHVSDQCGVWRNIHEACCYKGIIVSITPFPGGDDWWWHGEYYPTMKFFETFAALNGYAIQKHGIGREKPNRNLCVRMAKIEDRAAPFRMPGIGMYRNKIRPRCAAYE